MKTSIFPKKIISCLFLLFLTGTFFLTNPHSVRAATAGFHTESGHTYYIDSNGKRHTGWLTLNGKKYYFNPTTTYMFTGWQYDANKNPIRYFSKSTGAMCTGWVKNSEGEYRYFDKSTGIMFVGWQYDSDKKPIRYFSKKTGIMCTGWVKNSEDKYRYFNKKDGIMLTGYVYSKDDLRYFSTSTGIMYTGWAKTAEGLRYFNTSTGIMVTDFIKSTYGTRYFNPVRPASGIGDYGILLTGLRKIGNYYYYFNPAATLAEAKDKNNGGFMAVSCFKTISGNTYYFQDNGQAKTGWLKLNGNNYYFSSKGVMYKNKTATDKNNITYNFDANGVATVVTQKTGSTIDTNYTYGSNGFLNVRNSAKTISIYPSYLNIPGVSNGSIDDITLLAAVADREMGGSDLSGMVSVCLCVLNRTLKENTAFPDNFRFCIYQYPQQFSEDAAGNFPRLEARLKNPGSGFPTWFNEPLARQAAKKAFEIFDNYVKYGTPRKVEGFATKDFDYVGFMTPAAFASARATGGLDPARYETYQNLTTYFDCWNKAWGNQ